MHGTTCQGCPSSQSWDSWPQCPSPGGDRPSSHTRSWRNQKGQNSILRERNCRKKKKSLLRDNPSQRGKRAPLKNKCCLLKIRVKKILHSKKPKTNKKTTLRKRVQTSKCFHGVGGRVSHLACSAWGVGVRVVRQSGGGGRRSHPTMPIGLKCKRLEM